MKKAFIKRLSAALCVLALLIGTGFVAAPRARAAASGAQGILESCVRLYTEEYPGGMYDGDGYAAQNTGVCVGRANEPVEYIVTRWEAIEQYSDTMYTQPRIPDLVYVVLETNKIREALHAVPVYFDKGEDLAILKLEEPTHLRKPATLMSAESVRVSDKLYFPAFPNEMFEWDADSWLPASTEDMILMEASVLKTKRYRDDDPRGRPRLELNIGTFNYNNSGGPLVTEDGYVAAIQTYSDENVDDDGGPYDWTLEAVWIDYAMLALDGLNVDYMSVDGNGKYLTGEPGKGLGGIAAGKGRLVSVLVIAVAACGLAAVIVLLCRQRGRKRSAAAAGVSTGTYAYTPPSVPPAHTPAAPAPASGGLRSSSSFAAPKSGTDSAAPFAGASGPKPTEEEAYFKKNSGF